MQANNATTKNTVAMMAPPIAPNAIISVKSVEYQNRTCVLFCKERLDKKNMQLKMPLVAVAKV